MKNGNSIHFLTSIRFLPFIINKLLIPFFASGLKVSKSQSDRINSIKGKTCLQLEGKQQKLKPNKGKERKLESETKVETESESRFKKDADDVHEVNHRHPHPIFMIVNSNCIFHSNQD